MPSRAARSPPCGSNRGTRCSACPRSAACPAVRCALMRRSWPRGARWWGCVPRSSACRGRSISWPARGASCSTGTRSRGSAACVAPRWSGTPISASGAPCAARRCGPRWPRPSSSLCGAATRCSSCRATSSAATTSVLWPALSKRAKRSKSASCARCVKRRSSESAASVTSAASRGPIRAG